MTIFRQQTEIILDCKQIVNIELSIPHWDELTKEPASRGIVRHGGVRTAVDYVGAKLKPSYSEHLQNYLERHGDPTGQQPRTLLAWGSRNTFQNLGLPGWNRRANPNFLGRPDEPWRYWDYRAFGSDCSGLTYICQVRFEDDNTGLIEPNVCDRSDAKLNWLITGQPILWDGILPRVPELAAQTYDLRHVWQLHWEDWQDSPTDSAIHDELMNCFMRHLSEPLNERAAALAGIADRHHLSETDGYLHSSLGIDQNNNLTLLMKTGSLTQVGKAQRQLGAKRAILLDNGGSVGAAYWSQHLWDKLGYAAIRDKPIVLGNGTYFRPRGHALLIAELAADLREGPSV